MNEEWRPVVGYEGYYEVSNQGRVKSLARRVPKSDGTTMSVAERVMSLFKTADNGRAVGLSRDSIGRTRLVHQLVAEAFIGPRPEGQEVCHNDGDRTNNTPENLRYDTHLANILDSVRHGTHPLAKRTACVNGHPFTPENTAHRTDSGGRRCRACRLRVNTAKSERRTAERLARRAALTEVTR